MCAHRPPSVSHVATRERRPPGAIRGARNGGAVKRKKLICFRKINMLSPGAAVDYVHSERRTFIRPGGSFYYRQWGQMERTNFSSFAPSDGGRVGTNLIFVIVHLSGGSMKFQSWEKSLLLGLITVAPFRPEDSAASLTARVRDRTRDPDAARKLQPAEGHFFSSNSPLFSLLVELVSSSSASTSIMISEESVALHSGEIGRTLAMIFLQCHPRDGRGERAAVYE